MTSPFPSDADAALFGNRFATREVPSTTFPDTGMTAVDAMRLVAEDLALEGDLARNLATFVTTWMEPEARIIAENLHRNFIDHAEYPRTAEIEQRAAYGCSPTSSTRRERPPAREPRLVRGDHARGPLPEVELAQAPSGGRRIDYEPEPRLRRRRPSCGRSSAVTSTSSPGSSRSARAGTRSAPTTSPCKLTRTPSGSQPCSARPSPATRTTSSASTTCSWGSGGSVASTSRCTSTAPAAASSGRSSTRTRRGTSASNRCAPSTSQGTSSGWSIPESAG